MTFLPIYNAHRDSNSCWCDWSLEPVQSDDGVCPAGCLDSEVIEDGAS